ncbi:MAG: hypothetical protein U1E76_15490 [Planctomycetota bacterium]
MRRVLHQAARRQAHELGVAQQVFDRWLVAWLTHGSMMRVPVSSESFRTESSARLIRPAIRVLIDRVRDHRQRQATAAAGQLLQRA